LDPCVYKIAIATKHPFLIHRTNPLILIVWVKLFAKLSIYVKRCIIAVKRNNFKQLNLGLSGHGFDFSGFGFRFEANCS